MKKKILQQVSFQILKKIKILRAFGQMWGINFGASSSKGGGCVSLHLQIAFDHWPQHLTPF